MGNKRIQKRINEQLSADEQVKLDRFQEERSDNLEQLKGKMVGYLSALNDGVIAIFITVMMLEIPYPSATTSYHTFLWSIAIFMVSFFIIADFWYDNKRVFQTFREADHLVVVADFLFLASLALIPVTTTWIMNEGGRYATIHFGIVYLITLLMQQLLLFSGVRDRFRHHTSRLLRIILMHIGFILILDACLITLSWFYPKQAMVLFIAVPLISFFKPDSTFRLVSDGSKASISE